MYYSPCCPCTWRCSRCLWACFRPRKLLLVILLSTVWSINSGLSATPSVLCRVLLSYLGLFLHVIVGGGNKEVKIMLLLKKIHLAHVWNAPVSFFCRHLWYPVSTPPPPAFLLSFSASVFFCALFALCSLPQQPVNLFKRSCRCMQFFLLLIWRWLKMLLTATKIKKNERKKNECHRNSVFFFLSQAPGTTNYNN